jgi:FSR family fosmidomycin resistance protein-like MFS transporter
MNGSAAVDPGCTEGGLTMVRESVAPTRSTRVVPWALGVAHLMNDTASGIVPALLPLYRAAFHLTYFQSGLIVLLTYLTSSVMQPLFGAVTDRRPYTWLLPAGVSLSTLALALSGLMPSYPLLLAILALSGLGSGAFHPEASRAIYLAAEQHRKGATQAIFQVGGNSGQALGPLVVAGLAATLGLRGLPALLILTAVALTLTVRVLPWYRDALRSGRYARSRRDATEPNRVGAMALLVAVVVLRSWCQLGVSSFLPFYYVEHHLALAHAELYTFLFLMAGAVGTYLGGALSDRIGKKNLLLLSMVLAIPGAWLLPRVGTAWAVPVLILFGFTVLASFAVTVVFGQALLPRNIGLASGLMIGFSVGAGGIGASILGLVADHWGVTTVLNLLVVLPIAAAVLTLWLPDDRRMARPVP